MTNNPHLSATRFEEASDFRYVGCVQLCFKLCPHEWMDGWMGYKKNFTTPENI